MKVIQKEILDGLDDGTFGIKQIDGALDINSMTANQAIQFKRSVQEIIFANTDSDGNLCVFPDGDTTYTIRNRLGSTLDFLAIFEGS